MKEFGHARKKLLLYGYFGQRNTGDDAMLYALVELLIEGGCEYKINISANGLVSFPKQDGLKIRIIKRTYLTILIHAATSDVVIVGGGSTFHDHGMKFRYFIMNLRLLGLAILCKLFNTKIYLIAVGIGPYVTNIGAKIGKLIVKFADYITVRDTTSLEELRHYKIKDVKYNLTTDLALKLKSKPDAKCDSNILGVSLIPYFRYFTNDPGKDARLAQSVAEVINNWLNENAGRKVHLLPFSDRINRAEDMLILRNISELVHAQKRTEIIEYTFDPYEMLANISQCKAIIAMRYHAAVFAYITNRPMIIIDYHSKCKNFAKDVQLNDKAVLTIENVLEGRLNSRLGDLMENDADYVAKRDISEVRNMLDFALPEDLRK